MFLLLLIIHVIEFCWLPHLLFFAGMVVRWIVFLSFPGYEKCEVVEQLWFSCRWAWFRFGW